MSTAQPRVAVLLATYNGARYLYEQLKSLTDNGTPFQLHWLDDHSTDNTRALVRHAAAKLGIELVEWHQPERLQVPAAFFQLMECAEADIYLFCDQDDIWQPGKIDAAVADLAPNLSAPLLCYTEPFIFLEGKREVLFRTWDVFRINNPRVLESTRVFLSPPAIGHTIGFTRLLRDIYLKHRHIARGTALMHDCWMYIIANSCGAPRLLSNAPTTLWRRHEGQASARFVAVNGKGIPRYLISSAVQQAMRRRYARQAQGFLRAVDTLVAGPRLEQLLPIARIVSSLDQQQSPLTVLKLARHRALSPRTRTALRLATMCIRSDAPPDVPISGPA